MRRQQWNRQSVYAGCIVALMGSFFIGIDTLAHWQASQMAGQTETWRESLRSGGNGSLITGIVFVAIGFYFVHSSLKAVTTRPLTASARATETGTSTYLTSSRLLEYITR